MRNLITAACIVFAIAASAAPIADARLFDRVRSRWENRQFKPFQNIRSRFGGRCGSASGGCSDCASHGIGPDGFRIKK